MLNETVESEMKKPEYGMKTKKHLKQASAIVGLLENYKLLNDNTCYIEFGAGRGSLVYFSYNNNLHINIFRTIKLLDSGSNKVI